MGMPRAEPAPRRYVVFAVVSLALMMSSVDQTIVATALRAIQHDLHAQVNWSSWTITIYALGQVLVMPLAGKLGDQFGRKADLPRRRRPVHRRLAVLRVRQ